MNNNKKYKGYEKYYIAYGSNMNLEQMDWRCPNSEVVGIGYLKGWKLVFNCHADIIPTGNDNDVLPVLIWKSEPKEWKTLDRYEGFPTYYIRESVEFFFLDGTSDIGTVYVMAEDCKGLCPPSDYYFDALIDACRENGIDDDYMFDALIESCYNKTKYNQYNKRKRSDTA